MPSALQTIQVPADATHHTFVEDAQGLATGLTLCAIGVTILAQMGFVTGQTAGLALLISYATNWSFGWVFFWINVPFYVFAYYRLGLEFTLKSAMCVTVMSVLVDLMPGWMELESVNPVFGVIAVGCTCGAGLLAVFRHKGSLGGLGVVALIIQDTTGIRAGQVQLAFDAVLFAVALLFLPVTVVLYSLAGAAILNGIIAFNHRRDRYIAA